MKIVTTTVSKDGYRDPTAFEFRFAAFKEALELAKGEGIQLLCLPGGYFCVASDAEREKAESQIVEAAKAAGIAVAVGIDCSQQKLPNKGKATTPDTSFLVQTKALPSFAMTWSPQQEKQIWRQRSTTGRDQRLVSDEDCVRPQTLRVSGENIEILACGELFNERIRNSIIAGHPDAVVDLSHDGQGFRADHSMKLLARQGMHTFCCTHANKKGAMKRAFAPGGGKTSTPEADSVITGKPRIEMKIREI